MSYKFLFLILGPWFLFASCKEGIGSKDKTTLGYAYTKHIDTKGVKAKAGDHVYFNVITVAGDSVLEDTHIYPFTPTLRLEDKPVKDLAAIMDAMKEMAVGDSMTLFIPIDSIPFAPEAFQSFKVFKHIITLISIKNEADFKIDMDARNATLHAMADSLVMLDSVTRARLKSVVRDYNDKKLEGKLKTTAQGVKYLMLKEGEGIIPKSGDMIEVNYIGCLANYLVFDGSFSKGQPYPYRINTNSVIKGWDDALSTFKEGTEAVLFIPSAMGYGATGRSPSIPPNTELMFYVSLHKVRPMK